MHIDQLVRRQLEGRLTQIKRRIATLSAEAEMIQRMLADAEKFATIPRLKLRKNSKGKWSVHGQIRQFLSEHRTPVRAQAIYDRLVLFDPSLKASTFRSHMKRMVVAGILKREGPRGHYQLAAPVKSDEPVMDAHPAGRRRVSIGNYFV